MKEKGKKKGTRNSCVSTRSVSLLSKLFRSVRLIGNYCFSQNNPYQRMTFTVQKIFSVKNSD